MSRRALGQRVAPPPQPWSHRRRRSRDPSLPRSFLLSSRPPYKSTQVTRPARRGRSPRRAVCTHRDFLEPGLARVSPGRVPGGREAEARLELRGRGLVRRRVRRPRPRRGPSPLPPLPGPQRPSAPPEGGSAINKRVSVARGPRSCCASGQISGSGRRGSRHRETPARAGERAQARPPRPGRPGSAPSSRAPWLRGRRRPRRPPARRGLGAAGTETRSRTKRHSRLLAGPLHPLRKAEAWGSAGRKEEREDASGKPGLWSPRDRPARRRLRPGRRRWVAGSSGAEAAERRPGASGRPRAPARGPRPRLTRLAEPPSPNATAAAGAGLGGLEHVWV